MNGRLFGQPVRREPPIFWDLQPASEV